MNARYAVRADARDALGSMAEFLGFDPSRLAAPTGPLILEGDLSRTVSSLSWNAELAGESLLVGDRPFDLTGILRGADNLIELVSFQMKGEDRIHVDASGSYTRDTNVIDGIIELQDIDVDTIPFIEQSIQGLGGTIASSIALKGNLGTPQAEGRLEWMNPSYRDKLPAP